MLRRGVPVPYEKMTEEEIKRALVAERNRLVVKLRKAQYREAICAGWDKPKFQRKAARAMNELELLDLRISEIFPAKKPEVPAAEEVK